MDTRYVTIKRFSELTGYTQDAVNGKIKRGDWIEGMEWRRAPDGRRLVDVAGYEMWVRGERSNRVPAGG